MEVNGRLEPCFHDSSGNLARILTSYLALVQVIGVVDNVFMVPVMGQQGFYTNKLQWKFLKFSRMLS